MLSDICETVEIVPKNLNLQSAGNSVFVSQQNGSIFVSSQSNIGNSFTDCPARVNEISIEIVDTHIAICGDTVCDRRMIPRP